MSNKALSDEQLRQILEDSDFECSEIGSTFDDSDVDPLYQESDSEGSTTSNEDLLLRKRRKIESEFTPAANSSSDLPKRHDQDDIDTDQDNVDIPDTPFTPRNDRIMWSEVTNSDTLNEFIFSGKPGFCKQEIEKLTGHKPIDFFLLFFDEEVQNLLVTETNRYAEQQIVIGICNDSIRDHSILSKWHDTNANELMRFFALIIWMGLDQKPTLRDYYSKKVLYESDIPKLSGISRNRFEALLHFVHISDNENCPTGDRLYKISPLVQMLNRKFQHMCSPKEKVCIDETMVPFRGRLSFLQYIPGKRHKYGVKLFKLCVDGGYTYAVKIYGGGDGAQKSDKPLASRVVMELMEPLLNTGRTLYTDNFYTSVSLAHELNNKRTHLVGTLRQNRKLNPKGVTSAKLKKGEMKMQKSYTKVIVGKWKDKRDVLFLTTRAVPEMVEVITKRGPVSKPSAIVDYNTAKGFIDISDQRASYSSPVRRSIKWYRKILIELLTNTALVNALVVFTHSTNKKMSITEFRESIVYSLLDTANQPVNEEAVHAIQQKETRGRCSSCYKKYSEREGRQAAMKNAKKIYSFCPGCSENITYMCVSCFFERHRSFLTK